LISPKSFAKKLLSWSEKNPRNYPWTGEKDPYKIWISEIILQQTRSEQGKEYYKKFITKYPNVTQLAQASEDDILNSWKGLGYYSRARNLHVASKTILNEFHGKFPVSITDIKSLKGIGEYSAAAISSFAYNKPHAVVDGNVVRVLSRILGIDFSFYNSEGRKKFFETANKFLDKKNPAAYNQAIMNFGAVQCKPGQPGCNHCVFSKVCYAFQNNCIDELPVKSKKNELKRRFFHFFLFKNKSGSIAIQQRMEKDIWQKLYQLPLIESSKNLHFKTIAQLNKEEGMLKFDRNTELKFVSQHIQKLSHQEIVGRFYSLKFNKLPDKIKGRFCYVKPENLVNFAFPKIISVFLENFNSNRIC
jgi:A/G-specific adenine glycosylase